MLHIKTTERQFLVIGTKNKIMFNSKMLLNVVIFCNCAVKIQYIAVNVFFAFCLKLGKISPYCSSKFAHLALWLALIYQGKPVSAWKGKCDE